MNDVEGESQEDLQTQEQIKCIIDLFNLEELRSLLNINDLMITRIFLGYSNTQTSYLFVIQCFTFLIIVQISRILNIDRIRMIPRILNLEKIFYCHINFLYSKKFNLIDYYYKILSIQNYVMTQLNICNLILTNQLFQKKVMKICKQMYVIRKVIRVNLNKIIHNQLIFIENINNRQQFDFRVCIVKKYIKYAILVLFTINRYIKIQNSYSKRIRNNSIINQKSYNQLHYEQQKLPYNSFLVELMQILL